MKKFSLAAGLTLVSGCVSGAPDDPDYVEQAAVVIPVGAYNFGTLAAPGKCLDVRGAASASGTNIWSWSCNGGGAQSWWVQDLGNGNARLVNTPTGKCLDVAGAGSADGTNIQLWDCNSSAAAQQFRIEDAGGGNVRFVNAVSNKCVDVAAGGTADGTNVQLWSCNGSNAQKWRPASVTLAGGTYNLGSVVSPGQCVDVAGAGTAPGTNVWNWTCNGGPAQSFRVVGLADGTVNLVNTNSNLCVDIAGGGTADGTNIATWTCNGNARAQAFRVENMGGGNVRLVNPNSNKCVDVAGGGTAPGTNIQLASCNGSNAQLWRPALLFAGMNITAPPAPPPPPPPPPPTVGPTTSDWSTLAPRADGIWVRVKNKCSFPLWIHGEGSSGTLQPDDVQLSPGGSRDYVSPKEWSAARVTAYVDGPRKGELEKAEMTFVNGVLNYNVTYVDWLGLPLEIVGVGGSCNASQHTTGCYAQQAVVNNGCPEGALREGRKCVAPRSYCLNPANQGTALCHSLDSAIANCASCPKASTPEVFACSGRYAEEPRWCAALNRGMTNEPDNANASLYYQKGPYNTYAKWVHQVCPDIYAFSYDDWLSHGGFRACSGNELRITFCPSG